MTAAYHALEARFAQIEALESAAGVLSWDGATMMPPKGAHHRAAQLAALQGSSHRLLVAPQVPEWLSRAQSESLDAWQTANLRCMTHRYHHAASVPAELVERLAETGSNCEFTWRTAKKENDFATLLPALTEVITLVRELAAIKAEALKLSPYDAMLDGYDPGRRMTDIDPIFDRLARELPPILKAVEEKQTQRGDTTLPPGHYPAASQKALGMQVMQALGFDFDAGRLDESAHPFCSGSRGDIRLTTRYTETEWFSSLMGIIHETGHALYEQQLPEAWAGQPVGQALGMAWHESQSLSIEMQLSRSRAFMQWLTPRAQQTLGVTEDAATLHRAAIRVKRGFIRVDADEVTYPLHILLRYRLEKQLLSGELRVADLPDAWNEGMNSLLGITPPTHAQGCMQDIHWMDGSLGYFPTYTLGALTAAQLFHAMRKKIDIDALAAKGEFAPIIAWLGTHVHAPASSHESKALMQHATGESLNPDYFLAHVKARYLDS